jgi:hypothetical protein
MTAKGPRLANLALEGILPEDFRTDETVALKKALGSPLSATPMIVQGETFAGDTTVLHLVNPSASAAHFTIDLQASARFSAEPAGLKADLAAGAQANFAVKLWPVNGPCEVNATPLLARWQARTETAAGKTIQTGGKFALGPAEARDCPARTSPVAVDGKLEEWPSLPWTVDKAIWGYNPEQNAGPTDLSYRFATAYDANYLYVAVDVTDDKVVALPGRPPWEQDCVQVYLEPAPTADGSLGRVIYLAASPAPAGSDAPLGANNSSTWPVGTRAAVARTDKGYAAEFAVPIVVLDQAQGGAWSRFRLNIGVEDQDGIGKHYHVKWQPKWEWTDRAVPGLGTFMRR